MAQYREDIPYQVVEASSTVDERRAYWETAASLQAVDRLAVSEYACSQAGRYVAGELSASALAHEVESYYAGREGGDRQQEADIVAARITGLLESPSFVLRPSTLFAIHKSLFNGVLPDEWVGRARGVNLTKPEPVLGGRSVDYMDFSMVEGALDYDFRREAERPYAAPLDAPQVARFARFVAGVWQIHPFREGNTRTVATFSELYLRKLGVKATNDPFIENSVYFRDALVRASFASIELGVEEDYSFITAFFENVALGASNPLISANLNLHGVRADDDKTGYRE